VAEDFDGALTKAREALRSLASSGGNGDGEDGPARGVGEGADGLIRVVAEGGRLHSVEIDPRAMRLPSEDLAGEFREAANAALAAQASTVPPISDPAALAKQLEELQDYSVREMARYTQSVNEVLERMRRRG
jgi:hypothetical protein